jgi:hypothetical protein
VLLLPHLVVLLLLPPLVPVLSSGAASAARLVGFVALAGLVVVRKPVSASTLRGIPPRNVALAELVVARLPVNAKKLRCFYEMSASHSVKHLD